jgi:undecaprenyl-phosphate galactose phosphotransferase
MLAPVLSSTVTKFGELSKPSITSLGKKFFCGISLFIGDLCSLALAATAITLTHSYSFSSIELLVYIIISGLFVLSAASRGHYSRRIPFWDQARELIKLFGFFALTQGAVSSLLPNPKYGITYMAGWALAFVLVVLVRAITKEALLKTGFWKIPTVIIGDGPNAEETALALLGERHLGYEIVSFLSPLAKCKPFLHIKDRRIPVRNIDNRSNKVLRRLGNPYIVIALEHDGINKLQSQIDRLILDYPSISVAPALRGLPLFGAQPYHFFSHEVMMLEIKNNLSKLTSRTIKRAFDIGVGLALLVMLFPAFIIISYLVRKSGKQIIFGHERIGLNGKKFRCYKFRSMVENSREALDQLLATSDEARREWYKDFKLKNDPRITKFGKFLRQSSLDELPQLWNVIRGDMSLVGPRPVIQDEIPFYGNYVNFYYRSRPGLTGLWQVSGRSDLDYESRVQLDVWYVSNWSLWNDVVILMRTVTVVLNKSGAY